MKQQHNRLTKDVSCRVTVDYMRYIKSLGIQPEAVFDSELMQTLHPAVSSFEYLSKPGNWINWNSFVSIHNAMRKHVFSTPEQRRAFIEGTLRGPGLWIRVFYPLMTALVHPSMIYRLLEWAGGLNFRNVIASISERSRERFVLTLSLRNDDRPLPEYFEMVGYTLSLLPTIIGYEPAEVRQEISGASGTYTILIPKKKKRLQGLRRAFNFLRVGGDFDRTLESWEKSRIELQHSAQMLTSILEHTPDSIMLVDRESVIHYINKVAEGISVDVVGMKALDFIPGKDRGRYRQALDKAYDQSCKDEFETQASHDNSHWNCKTVPLTSPTNERLVLVIASDITRQKNAADSIISARNQALAASRAKDVFLANMSHEVRTPLTAIIGFSEILRSQNLPDNSQKCVDIIARNGTHLLNLINDILNISRIEAEEVAARTEVFNPSQVLSDIIESHKVRLENRPLRIVSEFAAGIPAQILADRTHLTQIFSNVLDNSVKFTERGQVTVTAGSEGSQLILRVADTGSGVPPESRESIFEPFRQIDMSGSRRHGGSGLGLAIARKLARMHGGDVILEKTAVGEGSTFFMTFPFRLKTGGDDNVDRKSVPASDLSGKKVLIVEDHPDIAVLLTTYMEQADAKVTAVPNGSECLAFTGLAEIDLILLDLQMPGLDGYETFSRVKAAGYRGKVFAVSAHAGETERQKCREVGFDAFISKPVSRAELMARVREHL